MQVSVTELRKNLSRWLDRVGDGEVIVTDRGVPVARIVGVESASAISELTRSGAIAAPSRSGPRPVASGRSRPRPKRPIAETVSEQRR